MERRFPDNFFWGSAMSSHQVEGGNINDWSQWEKQNAERLAQKAQNYWQAWQKEKFPEMLDPANYISGRSCDHYHLYERDFDIAKSLGQNAHRFSLEWSRIESQEGKFNNQEMEHYKKVVLTLRSRGLEPFVTINHWTLPLWFAEKGGWQNRQSVKYFSRFVEYIVRAIGSQVNFWITLNEPWIFVSHSYLKGVWPPQKKNFFLYLKVFENQARAHKEAYRVIKKINPSCLVGVAENNIYFEGWAQCFANRLVNHRFLNKVKNQLDFIGLNYYFRNKISIFKVSKIAAAKAAGKEVSDMGWEIYPAGIYQVLKKLKKYKKPIYITENGIADKDDLKRAKFIKDHLIWIHQAISEGVPVGGYFYWSLLDNFEWDKGFWPRFGLVEVNYKTLERKIRPSAWQYAKICKNNGLF